MWGGYGLNDILLALLLDCWKNWLKAFSFFIVDSNEADLRVKLLLKDCERKVHTV